MHLGKPRSGFGVRRPSAAFIGALESYAAALRKRLRRYSGDYYTIGFETGQLENQERNSAAEVRRWRCRALRTAHARGSAFASSGKALKEDGSRAMT